MVLPLLAILLGLALLAWSAARFVAGSSETARHLRVPPLLIGMVVVGFGTSAPELVISVLAATQGNPGLALGNAIGSNIANIGLILGLAALITPITVNSRALRQELPLLALLTGLVAFLLRDGELSRAEAWVLLGTFAGGMTWSVKRGLRLRRDELGREVAAALTTPGMPLGTALSRLALGLLMLIVGSRALVWGAIELAHGVGLSDHFIGLTIVAVGTSLPELATAIVAAWKREDDIALGNVIGSNLFNTAAVIGVAGAIRPLADIPEVLTRDLLVMGLLTLALFVVGYRFDAIGRITRAGGAALVACYVAYTALLVADALTKR